MMVQFSVLMSVYSKEQPSFLDLCFSSLAQQTLLADEIVLVEDGPITVELEGIVEKWMKILPIRNVKIERNVGLGKALQIGLASCTFDYIARMDTDDIAAPNRFELQVEYIRKNPQTDLVGGDITEFFNEPTNIQGLRLVPRDEKQIRKYSKYKSPFNHVTVFFRKAAILNVGGYMHHQFMEDYNLWLRLIASNAKIVNIPKVLVNARASRQMYMRRSGWVYFRSEYELFLLKNKLKILNTPQSFLIFCFRGLVRFLPACLLGFIYKLNRKRFQTIEPMKKENTFENDGKNSRNN